MKILIKSGDCPSYLTVGKAYEVTRMESKEVAWIKDDDGYEVAVYFRCPQISDGSWEIVDD